MSLKAMYNQVAHQYAEADRFGSIGQSHALALQQIFDAKLGKRTNYKVLDLGVGDAAFVKKLSTKLKHAAYTGIDISPDMLALAKHNFPELVTIEGSSARASHLVPIHTQDLVLAHFINAYLPMDVLFEQAAQLTRANGYFSLITTTYDSFPVAQAYLADFIASKSIWSTVVGHYYKAMIKRTTVATNLQELLDVFDTHQFDVVSKARLSIPVALKDVDDLARFGIEGTWFLNSLNLQMVPKQFLLERMRRFFGKVFAFPYEDMHIIDVVLAKKR